MPTKEPRRFDGSKEYTGHFCCVRCHYPLSGQKTYYPCSQCGLTEEEANKFCGRHSLAAPARPAGRSGTPEHYYTVRWYETYPTFEVDYDNMKIVRKPDGEGDWHELKHRTASRAQANHWRSQISRMGFKAQIIECGSSNLWLAFKRQVREALACYRKQKER